MGARYTVAAIISLLRTWIPGEIDWVFVNLSWNFPLWQEQCCVCREGYQASSELFARSESFYDVTKSLSLFPEALAPAVKSAVCVIHKWKTRLLAARSIFVTPHLATQSRSCLASFHTNLPFMG